MTKYRLLLITKHRLLVAAASAALLIGTAGFSQAIDLNVGGTTVKTGNGNSGGTAVSVGSAGGVSAKATVGGGNNVAKGTVTVGDDKATVSIGIHGTGPLAKVDSKGNPITGGSATSGDVDLGSLLGIFGGALGGLTDDLPGIGGTDGDGSGDGTVVGGGGSGGGAGDGVNAGKVKVIVAGMNGGERAQLKITCRGVLANPTGYDPKLIQLCRVLVKL